MAMTREQAWDLLTKYNQEPFHLRHAITVEHVMGWFAEKLGYGEEAEFWSLVGLFSRLLLDLGCTVFAVEPNDDMRAAAQQELGAHPRFFARGGATATRRTAARTFFCADVYWPPACTYLYYRCGRSKRLPAAVCGFAACRPF